MLRRSGASLRVARAPRYQALVGPQAERTKRSVPVSATQMTTGLRAVPQRRDVKLLGCSILASSSVVRYHRFTETLPRQIALAGVLVECERHIHTSERPHR
jgi:hypothetical protein